MSSKHQQWDFDNEENCVEYFYEYVYPRLSELTVSITDIGSHYAEISFGKTREYNGMLYDGFHVRVVKNGEKGILDSTFLDKHCKLQRLCELKRSKTPIISGRLMLGDVKTGPVFCWDSIDEMINKIKELMCENPDVGCLQLPNKNVFRLTCLYFFIKFFNLMLSIVLLFAFKL